MDQKKYPKLTSEEEEEEDWEDEGEGEEGDWEDEEEENEGIEEEDHPQDVDPDAPLVEEFDNLPSWTSITLRGGYKIEPIATMLFDGYIVILLNDFHAFNGSTTVLKTEPKRPLTLLAVDLRDNSIQEAQIHDPSFFFEPGWGSFEAEPGNLPYTLTKYGDNQILRYGVGENGQFPPFSLLTIESFQPFTVKCENFKVKGPKRTHHTAHFYNDFLYVIGGVNMDEESDEENEVDINDREQLEREELERKEKQKSIWRFDIKNRVWEELKPTGEDPDTSFFDGKNGSFLYGDNIYFYKKFQISSVVSALDLKSMCWTKVSPKGWEFPRKEDLKWKCIDQSIYQGHLLFMNIRDQVNCWNLETNSVKGFVIEKIPCYKFDHPIIYNNRLFLFNYLVMHILDLDEFGLKEETEEESHFKSLFMNNEGSDITLKVQDKEIPAHKEVLIKRSKYFAGLFNSGMSESRESVIEIQDCDYDLFEEFLGYLYTREAYAEDELAMKLIKLADKYVQSDMSQEYLEFLKFTVKPDNVFKRFDFACEQNLDDLKEFYKNYLKNNIDIKSLSGLMEYIEKIPEVKSSVVDFIVKKFKDVFKEYKKNWSFYEDFLIKNVDMSTISLFVNFIYWKDSEIIKEKEDFESIKGQIMQNTLRLKQACLEFSERNFKKIDEKNIVDKLPNQFLLDLARKARDNLQ